MTDDEKDDLLNSPLDYFIPRMIAKGVTVAVLRELPAAVKDQIKLLAAQGWRFYPVTQVRGRCYFKSKVITIPKHALDRELGYLCYYVCHEMAHAIAGWEANHGQEFMKVFMTICPKEYQKYELGYKPRNATAAGIFDISDL